MPFSRRMRGAPAPPLRSAQRRHARTVASASSRLATQSAAAPTASPVRRQLFFVHFCIQNTHTRYNHFIKTGSGQHTEKLNKEDRPIIQGSIAKRLRL